MAFIFIFLYIFIHRHTHTLTRTHVYTHTHTYTHNHTLSLTRTYSHTQEKLKEGLVGKGKDGIEPINDLVFVGLVTLQDPPRDEVPQAIRECHSAGVKVVMVTGEYVRGCLCLLSFSYSLYLPLFTSNSLSLSLYLYIFTTISLSLPCCLSLSLFTFFTQFLPQSLPHYLSPCPSTSLQATTL